MKRQPPIRAVLFDWDGTLLDSYHADSQAYLGMFHMLGIRWGIQELHRHYSPNWHRVYRAARLPRSRWDAADQLWARFYRRQNPRLLPGARQVLRRLAACYVLGLVTSGNRARIVRQLRRFGLAPLFSVRVCAEDARCRKPHPAPLQEALRRLKLPPEVCIYVGDAAEDIEMARRARVRSVAVLGPFPTHGRLRAASRRFGTGALLESIRELPAYLRAFDKR